MYDLKTLVRQIPILVMVLLMPPCALTAAEVPSTVSAPATMAAPFKRIAQAETLLVGSWRSVDAPTNKAAPGVMYFQSNGAVLIAPDGYQPLVGTWAGNAKTIQVLIKDHGDARIRYEFSKGHKVLKLRYDNGLEQQFFRLPLHMSTRP